MLTVTMAGRVSGNASFHAICQSVQPSSRIDSNSSRGTSRMKLLKINTVSGIPNAIDGKISAPKRVVHLDPGDDQVDGDDRRLQRDGETQQEQGPAEAQ